MKAKATLLAAGAVLGAFVISGPLQHLGVLPQSALGDASKAAIRYALNMTSEPAFASCGGGAIRAHGNNGWGNGGGDGVPGHSKFSDHRR